MPAKPMKIWTPSLIKRLRGKRTQEEFAGMLGAPKNTVWRWESGYTVPTAAYVTKLSAIAEKEKFFSGWKAVGSITWVGDLDAGAREIAREFSRTLFPALRTQAKPRTSH